MSPAGRSAALLVFLGLCGLAACVGLVAFLAVPDSGSPPVGSKDGPIPIAKNEPPPVAAKPVEPPAPPGPKRMPVGGQEGFFVVINLDGSSYLEAPDGTKTKLAEAGPVLIPPREVVVGPPPRKPIGQLVVCDAGVVDVPRDAVITLIGKDKVVTHDESGATTYYTDGRVERRSRLDRKEPPRK